MKGSKKFAQAAGGPRLDFCCAELPDEAEDAPGKVGGKGEKVFIREYEAGRMLREDHISAEEMEAVFGPFRRRAKDKAERRLRHRRRVRSISSS